MHCTPVYKMKCELCQTLRATDSSTKRTTIQIANTKSILNQYYPITNILYIIELNQMLTVFVG